MVFTFKLNNGTLLERGTPSSAGIDIILSEPLVFPPGVSQHNLHFAIENYYGNIGCNKNCIQNSSGYYITIYLRSSAQSYGLTLHHPVIDSDYTGDVFVSVWNDTNQEVIIPSGCSIFQMVVLPYVIIPGIAIRQEKRGEGNKGSTGRVLEFLKDETKVSMLC